MPKQSHFSLCRIITQMQNKLARSHTFPMNKLYDPNVKCHEPIDSENKY